MYWTGLTWKDYKESLTAGGISCIKKAVVGWIREIFLSSELNKWETDVDGMGAICVH